MQRLFYRFRSLAGGRVAATNDLSGANLPTDSGPWESGGTFELDEKPGRIGTSPEEIVAAIAAKGYFIWPDDNA